MSGTLWGSGGGLDAELAAYTAGDDRQWDGRLLRWDVIGTLGHVLGLAEAGLLSADEHRRLVDELRLALAEADDGRFTVGDDDEDAHTALEIRLVARLGELGEKVHTGRSRNDQVLAAMRLYLKDRLLDLELEALETVGALLAFGRRHARVVLPGYTHLRRAMPTTLGLWAAGYAEALLDDLGLVDAAFDLADRSPLGSGAGYGVPLALDRRLVAEALGFARPQRAVTAVQLSRGKLEAVVLSALWTLARDLAALSWDVILFSAEEYGYLVLPAELATGSSIMPHKRNPDVFELTRGRAGVVAGLAMKTMAVAGSLPGGYHRDLQLVKGPVMAGVETVRGMLRMMTSAVPRLGVDRARCAAAVVGDLLVTDEVYRRVRGGATFRSAYRAVAAEVRRGVQPPPIGAGELLAAREGLAGAQPAVLAELGRDVALRRRRLAARRRRFDVALERLTGGGGGTP